MGGFLSKTTLDGNVETMLLSILQAGSSYGYQIVQDLNEKAPHLLDFGEGTVYPVLHRMEKRGLIAADWRKGETGRRRKYYSLTDQGRKVLAANREQWCGLVEAMSAVLEPKTS
ncbi:MAG: helix-turn-helix transcriptional regulator [Verrucomicrobiota bacterium]